MAFPLKKSGTKGALSAEFVAVLGETAVNIIFLSTPPSLKTLISVPWALLAFTSAMTCHPPEFIITHALLFSYIYRGAYDHIRLCLYLYCVYYSNRRTAGTPAGGGRADTPEGAIVLMSILIHACAMEGRGIRREPPTRRQGRCINNFGW
jgi:hypothetical protein